MKKLIAPWFKVDSRALGVYRILIGWVCALDIIRRWNYIDVFYSNQAISMLPDTKAFNIFNYVGNSSIEIHIVFIIGILFSISLMIGYKSKLSHLITAIIIISIHSQEVVVGNSGDTFLNSMLIWTLFLPLGKSFSLDSLSKSLKNFKELKVEDLNNRIDGINKPTQIYSIAYFMVLIQISSIYFLSAINRIDKGTWENGTAFYKMYQLDGFITSFGYYVRDYINYPISKFFTYSSLYLEYSVPFLILFPFYRHILRLITTIALTTFHIMIRLSMHVGLFSQIMISTFPLLVDQRIFDFIKSKILKRYNNKFHLFYDSDCGFCHYSVRVIKRLDVFNRIIFCDGNSKIEKPKEFDELSDKTAILYNNENNIIWTRHKVFGKILSLLPFGFLISWIFFIPILSEIFGIIYDQIAKNRTKISSFFGLPACDISQNISDYSNQNIKLKQSYIKKHTNRLIKIVSPLLVIILFSASMGSALKYHKANIKDVIEYVFEGFSIIYPGNTNELTKFKKELSSNIEQFNFSKNKPLLYNINRAPRMLQKWTMFENVPNIDQIIIVEATLENNEKINLFTGKKSEFHTTDYSVLMKNKSQLWRKFFEWLYNKHKRGNAHIMWKNKFTNWILDENNTYFNKNLDGNKIKDVEIWKISENSPSPKINYKKITTKTRLEDKPNYGKGNLKRTTKQKRQPRKKKKKIR